MNGWLVGVGALGLGGYALSRMHARHGQAQEEQALARRAASAAIETELKTTIAGLLLHSQLALSDSEMTSPIAEKLRVVADLAGNLRRQLSAPSASRSNTHA